MAIEIMNVNADSADQQRYVDKFVAGAEQEERNRPFDREDDKYKHALDLNQLAIKEDVHFDKPEPLVSVLLASYNHEKYVEAAVRSVMNQRGVAFELIVLDDGSKDNSPKILEKLSKELGFRYIHRPNKGVIATLNEMLELAKGKFFCTFSSDDIMPQDRLCKQSLYMQNNPRAVACFGQVKSMTEDGVVCDNVDETFMQAVPEIHFEELFLGQKALHGCAEMFVTEAVRKLGGYDGRFFFEDYPLYLRVVYEYGPQPVLPDVVCCHYRDHGNNMHANHSRMYAEFLRIIDLYKDHKLYPKAVQNWKAKWFSALAYNQKGEALKRLPKLASFSPAFLKRLPKLFIPSIFLTR